jgi:mono/diheme cytochrome c family protein
VVEIRFDEAGEGYELALARELIQRGVEQLVDAQLPGGLWPHYQNRERPSVAVSALAAYALARAGQDLDEIGREELKSVLLKLTDAARRGEDGGLVDPLSFVPHRTYATGLLLMALGEGVVELEGADPAPYAAWLADAQVHEAHGFDPIDARYGGWSYYDRYQIRMRTDLSTARFALQGLAAAQTPGDAPVWGRASLFLDELQNLATITAPGDVLHEAETELRDGGFCFFPRSGKAGESPLGEAMVVGTAYGSATADGLLSLLATLGLDRRASADAKPLGDPRVLAALRWLARSYTLERTPGFGEDPTGWGQGLYWYYVAALAEGLHRAGVGLLVTPDSERHPWAAEVVRTLADRHGRGGRRFSSDSGLMHEDAPAIAAAFGVIALAAARDRLERDGGWVLKADGPPRRPPREVELKPVATDARARGQAIFKAQACFSCHMDGQVINAPSLVGFGDRALVRFRSAERARSWLKDFLRAPSKEGALSRGEYPAAMQPVTADRVDDAALEDLVTFLLGATGARPVSSQ